MTKEKQNRWTTIKVPVELRDQIKALADYYRTTEWRIVEWGISFVQEQKKRPKIKEELPVIDKVAWYITKLAQTVGAFRTNPTAEKLNQVKRVAQQIQERLGIDTRMLIRVAEDYYKNRNVAYTADLRIELTAELKMVIIDIIWKKLMKEENGLYSK